MPKSVSSVFSQFFVNGDKSMKDWSHSLFILPLDVNSETLTLGFRPYTVSIYPSHHEFRAILPQSVWPCHGFIRPMSVLL